MLEQLQSLLGWATLHLRESCHPDGPTAHAATCHRSQRFYSRRKHTHAHIHAHKNPPKKLHLKLWLVFHINSGETHISTAGNWSQTVCRQTSTAQEMPELLTYIFVLENNSWLTAGFVNVKRAFVFCYVQFMKIKKNKKSRIKEKIR